MGCDAPHVRSRLSVGDIVPVYSLIGSTKTLAMVERVIVGDIAGEWYEVLYNDGTFGYGCEREEFGKIITDNSRPHSDEAIAQLLSCTLRDFSGRDLFKILIAMRKYFLQKVGEVKSR